MVQKPNIWGQRLGLMCQRVGKVSNCVLQVTIRQGRYLGYIWLLQQKQFQPKLVNLALEFEGCGDHGF